MINDQLLFKASIDIYLKYGTKFTMDELAKSMRISKRTLYEYVSTKENLIRLVVNHYFDEVKAKQFSIYNDDSISILDKIKRILTSLPETGLLDNSRIEDLRLDYNDVFIEIDKRLSTGWELTFELMDTAYDNGIINKVDKEIFKSVYVASIENFLANMYNQPRPYSKMLNELVDMFLYGIILRS